ncbi:MAG: hypothetical protein H7844_14975 [Nitrospirae bacterium YQR-1]
MKKLVEIFLLSLLGFSTFIVFYRLFDYHYNIIAYPFILEYREGVQLLSTDLITKGGNPFDIANQPMYLNYYGFVYNVIAVFFMKFTSVFDNSTIRLTPALLIHRIVSALGILLSCLVVFYIMYRKKIRIIYIFPAIVILYASLLYSVTSISRPDSIGMFFFLMSIYLPWRYSYSKGGLLLSILFGIFAFYTKQYFILGVIMVLSYVFLFVSKKKAITFTFLFFLSFFSIAVIVNRYLEMFFYNTLITQFGAGHYSISFLYLQIKSLILYHSTGLTIILVCIVLYKLYRSIDNFNFISFKSIKIMILDTLSPANYKQPLFSINCSIFTYCMITSLLVIIFLLGGYDGSYMTYIFQLLMPFLIIFIFKNIPFKNYAHFIVIPLIIMNLFSSYYFTTGFYLYQTDAKNWFVRQYYRMKESPTWRFYNPDWRLDWKMANYTVKYHRNVLASTPLSVSLLLIEKPVYDSGATYYASKVTKAFNKINLLQHMFPFNYSELLNNYLKSISSMVENNHFDILFLDKGEGMWLISEDKIKKSGYINIGGPTLFIPHTGEYFEMAVWKKPALENTHFKKTP